MDLINKCNNCVPILFKCVNFMVNKYHEDLFGTFVRFFPLFNFPNNPCNIVICIDIDLKSEDYYRFKFYMKYKIKGINGNAVIERYLYKNLKPYLFANCFSFNMKKIDQNIIIDYINDAKKEKIISKGRYLKRLTNFGYGVDEIFLNDIFIENIGNIGNIGTVVNYHFGYFLFHSLEIIKAKNNIKMSSSFLSIIIGKYDKKNMTLDDKLMFIDKNIYNLRKRTKINNYLSIRFTKLIDFLIKEKINWIGINIQNIIHKYLSNIISSIIVININYKPILHITNINTYDEIYDTSRK